MDLLTPTDHAGAYEWASVFLAHFAIGLFLTAVVAAVLDALDGLQLNIGDTAAAIVTVAYLVAWEMGLQRLGAGLSLIHISEPTRPCGTSRMPSSA